MKWINKEVDTEGQLKAQTTPFLVLSWFIYVTYTASSSSAVD